jgi:hypothetical protein
VDLQAAIRAEHERVNALYHEYEQRYGVHLAPLPESVSELRAATVQIDPAVLRPGIVAALHLTIELLGTRWDVAARPSLQAVDECAGAWCAVAAQLTIDPLTAAVAAAAVSTIGLGLPLWLERRAIARGELLPASQRSASSPPPPTPAVDA